MQRTLSCTGRRLAAITLALSMLVATAGPAAAEYYVKRSDTYVVCV